MRETSNRERGNYGREMSGEFCRKIAKDLLHAANMRHGNDGFTSPPKEGMLRISAVFEPANLGTGGQHANH
jgi:hypothetical protein